MGRAAQWLAAVFMAALLIAGAVLLGVWLPSVLAGGPGLKFEACSVKTCGEVKKEIQDGLGLSGVFYILPDEVVSVRELPDCKGCATMVYRNRSTVHAQGSAADIRCRIWGGQYCVEGDRQ